MECPNCKKEIREEEKVCPHCQYDLEAKSKKHNENLSLIIGAVAIIIIVIVAVCIDSIRKNNISASSDKISNSSNETSSVEKKEDNPYKIFNDYDGIYSFLLLDNNGTGVDFDSVGAIEIKNGYCKAKYKILSKDNEYIKEYTGFAGKKNENDLEFYITLQKGSLQTDNIVYKCEFSDNKLLCELVSGYNLSGCSQKKLELIKNDEASDIELIYNQKLEEEKARRKEEQERKAEEEKQAFIASCQSYTFEQMARNPDNFKGTNVKTTGKVVQALYGTNTVDLRVNITKKGSYSTYYTDTIYVTYTTNAGEDKILEDDIITIYGISQGDYSYTSTMGSRITLPFVSAKYITIEK